MFPTSPQLCVGRVADVTDETSDAAFNTGSEGLDDLDMTLPGSEPSAEPSSLADPDPGADEPVLTADIDPEQLNAMEEAQRAMDEARSRLAEVPAEVVITNHVMGLYELAAIHLSAEQPDLAQAALAGALQCEPDWIAIADQDEGLDWRTIA